jgi:hypothetical protein
MSKILLNRKNILARILPLVFLCSCGLSKDFNDIKTYIGDLNVKIDSFDFKYVNLSRRTLTFDSLRDNINSIDSLLIQNLNNKDSNKNALIISKDLEIKASLENLEIFPNTFQEDFNFLTNKYRSSGMKFGEVLFEKPIANKINDDEWEIIVRVIPYDNPTTNGLNIYGANFDVGTYKSDEVENSLKIISEVFQKYIDNGEISSNVKGDLTGFADGNEINLICPPKYLGEMGPIQQQYFSYLHNSNRTSYINTGDKIISNETLAFLRAYYPIFYFESTLSYFNFSNFSFATSTPINPNDPQYRKVVIDFRLEVSTQILENIKSELESRNYNSQ